MTRARLPWICAACVAAAYLLTLASLRIPQNAPQSLAGASREEASPWGPDYSPQLATITALLLGTETPTPRPWLPTVTPQPSCTGAMSQGSVCWAATLVPTLPAPVVLPTPRPLPTWPGDAAATPNQPYVIGQSDD